jgi:hypothetical protein
MPREGLRPKRFEKIMNPLPILLSSPTEPKNVQKGLRVPAKRTTRIMNSQMLESRADWETLKQKTPSKKSHLGLCNGSPDGMKMRAPVGSGRMKMPSLVKDIHHRKMRG